MESLDIIQGQSIRFWVTLTWVTVCRSQKVKVVFETTSLQNCNRKSRQAIHSNYRIHLVHNGRDTQIFRIYSLHLYSVPKLRMLYCSVFSNGDSGQKKEWWTSGPAKRWSIMECTTVSTQCQIQCVSTEEWTDRILSHGRTEFTYNKLCVHVATIDIMNNN